MKIGIGWAALAAASLALAGCGKGDDGAAGNASASGATAGKTAAPAGQQWTETFSAAPSGGFVMGNPNAPVKLVEFGSLTCPHCAEFEEKSLPILKRDYIATGQVSLEFRNFIRDSADLTATLVARCGGAQPFFKMKEGIYAEQQTWFEKILNMTPAQKAELQKLPENAVLTRVAAISGLDQFAKLRGIPDAKLKACLSDKAELNKLDALQQTARDANVTGTPSFMINGKLQEGAYTWEAVEPLLKQAVAG